MRKTKPPTESDPATAPDINIWLAGLGAWAQAQAEGNKVFEALVRDGLSLQRQTQSLAEASLSQATEQLAAMTERASHTRLDGLSSLFDARVAKAMARLGLPDAATWTATQARLAELEAQVARLSAALGTGEVKGALPAGKAQPPAKAGAVSRSAKSQLPLPLQAPNGSPSKPAGKRLAPAKAQPSRQSAGKRQAKQAR